MPFAFTPVGAYTSARRVTPRAAACQLSPRAEREEVVQALISRAADRAAKIAADTASKAEAWAAEIATLRTPSAAEVAAIGTAASKKEPTKGSEVSAITPLEKPGELTVVQKSFFDRFATYAQFANEESVASVDEKQKASGVEGTLKSMGERIKDAVTTSSGSAKTEKTETDVMEAVKPGGFAPQKSTKSSASVTEEKKQRKSFGESLLDAIVEGVKPVVGEKRASSFEERVEGFVDKVEDVVEDVTEKVEDVVEDVVEKVEDVVEDVVEKVEDVVEKVEDVVEDVVEKVEDVVEDIVDVVEDVVEDVVDAVAGNPDEATAKIVPSQEIIDLVESGKVKNLTVTKLRRLLSENNLRTNGRKSELIARLTSFAKS